MAEAREKNSGAEAQREAGAPPHADLVSAVIEKTDLERIEKLARAKDEGQKERVRSMVDALVQETAKGHIQHTENLEEALDVAIARVDELLAAQLNPILHDENFQRVEATWRGLHYLVHETVTSTSLKLRVMDVSKQDLLKDLSRAPDFDQSGLFKKIYEAEYGTPGGEPYGLIIGDYYFGNTDPDLTLLEKIGEVAAAAHAPFIGGADPGLFGFDSFTELMEPRDLEKRFAGPEYARWRSLRAKPESRYVGLVLPRMLARLPYGPTTAPVEGLPNFEEKVLEHGDYVWANASWAFGARVTDAFFKYGWCTKITGREGGGGVVDGLPLHTFPADDGTMSAKCPTEIAITDRRDAELDKLGFIPLCHYKNTDFAVFFGAQSINLPEKYVDDWANANAELMAQLPHVFAVSRFAHYIKVMQRDRLGTFREREDVERELRDWISQYVLENPEAASDEIKARMPLREAEVTVHDVPGKPGHFKATLKLRPHFQMTSLEVSLRLVANLDQPS